MEPIKQMKSILRRREKAGLTRIQFAALAGVSRQYLHKLETGRETNPTIDTLGKLRAALEQAEAKQ